MYIGSQFYLCLPKRPSNTGLFSGPAVGTAQTLIQSSLVCTCLQYPWLPELGILLLCEHSVLLYILRIQSLPVDCVDLICSLYRWWKSFRSYSLTTLSCNSLVFYLHLCMRVIHRHLLLRLPRGLETAPVRSRHGGSTDAWIERSLAEPGMQGSRQSYHRAYGSIRVFPSLWPLCPSED